MQQHPELLLCENCASCDTGRLYCLASVTIHLCQRCINRLSTAIPVSVGEANAVRLRDGTSGRGAASDDKGGQ